MLVIHWTALAACIVLGLACAAGANPPASRPAVFTGGDEQIAALQADAAQRRTAGTLDAAVVRIGEASDDAAELRRRADLLHARVPGVQAALGGPRRAELAEFVDVFEGDAPPHPLLVALADCIETVRQRKRPQQYQQMIADANRLLAMNEGRTAGQRLEEPQAVDAAISQLKTAAAKLEKWDAGQLTYEKAVELRAARQTASRRLSLRQRHVAACARLGAEPLGEPQWNDLWPRRVLFRQDFEKDGDWDGQVETANVPPGSSRALLGATGSKYAARRIRVGIYYDYARAATTTWVRLRYLLSKAASIEVMAFDLTQRDNYAARIESPVVGRWTEVTLQITGNWRRKDGSRATMQAGDAIDDVFLLAGRAGDEQLLLLVDDVELLGRD